MSNVWRIPHCRVSMTNRSTSRLSPTAEWRAGCFAGPVLHHWVLLRNTKAGNHGGVVIPNIDKHESVTVWCFLKLILETWWFHSFLRPARVRKPPAVDKITGLGCRASSSGSNLIRAGRQLAFDGVVKLSWTVLTQCWLTRLQSLKQSTLRSYHNAGACAPRAVAWFLQSGHVWT